MVLKLGFTIFALLCVAKVLSSPVQPLGEKGLIGDIIIAEKAIQDFIATCQVLYNQVVTSSTTAINTIVTSVDSIVKQLGDLGLDPVEIQAIQDLANQCVANIEAIVKGLLDDITSIVDLLGQILDHLTNPIQLIVDIFELENAIGKLTEDFSTAFDRTLAEVLGLKNAIIGLLVNHTGEIVESILSDIEAVQTTLVAEYNAVLAAFNACIAAAAATLTALNNIVS